MKASIPDAEGEHGWTGIEEVSELPFLGPGSWVATGWTVERIRRKLKWLAVFGVGVSANKTWRIWAIVSGDAGEWLVVGDISGVGVAAGGEQALIISTRVGWKPMCFRVRRTAVWGMLPKAFRTSSQATFSLFLSQRASSTKNCSRIKGLFIWEKVISVSEKTFRHVYKRDVALL